MNIDKVVSGAYQTVILLADDTVTTLARYKQSGDTQNIKSVARGAYIPLVENDEGKRVSLIEHLRATGGRLVAKEVKGGYQGLVMVGDTINSVVAHQKAQEQANLAAKEAVQLSDKSLVEQKPALAQQAQV